MASVDWQKATIQKAGAVGNVHLSKDRRENGNHANKDIDTSKSHLNIYIGADDFSPMLEKVKARIKEVDKEHPPERNMGAKRITCMMLETPVPRAVTEQGKAADFLRDAHKVIEDFFGAENVGGTCCHFDEKHLYMDKDGSVKMSCDHGHTLCAAYVEWTDKKEDKETGEKIKIERKGINGKNCKTTPRMQALNKKMDAMSREKYGVPFLTGEEAQKKKVEDLKVESHIREIAKNIPPFEPIPYPEEPTFDEPKPETIWEGYEEDIKKNEREIAGWEKRQAKWDKKVHQPWKKQCEKIDEINKQRQEEWNAMHAQAEELTELFGKLKAKEEEIAPTYLKVKADERATNEELKAAQQLRKTMEQERQTQAENYDRDLKIRSEQLVSERERELFGKNGKTRSERLENYCDTLMMGDKTVLQHFEEQEEQLRREYKKKKQHGDDD